MKTDQTSRTLKLLPSKKGKMPLGRFLIPYRIYGESGPFIICVNGAQQTMASWYSAVSCFYQDYRIVLYDAPGQSRGTILKGDPAVSVEDQVKVLRSLHENLLGRHESIHLVGASWGAVIAAVYAAKYPDSVETLLLASFGLKPSKKMIQVIESARALFAVQKIRDGAELIIRTFGQKLTEENKQKLIRQSHSLTDEQSESIDAHLKVIASSGHLSRYVDLGKVKAKTVIINGGDDELLDREDLEQAAELIPNTEIRLIPGAGHFLHLEREDIIDIYAEYLNGAETSKSLACQG